jgi:hypothetical protein
MSTRSPLRRAAIAAVALLTALVLATPAAAYIIVMKDGSTLTAAKEYEVRGEMAIITLPSGAVTQIELEKIDQEKTKETNSRGYGDAQLVDDGTTRQVKKAPDEEERRRQDLSTLARRESALERPEPRRRAEREEVRTAPRTSAGFTDLSRITRQPFNDLNAASDVQRFFRGQAIDGVELYQGTQPDHLYVEITTASEASVFRALEVAAQALLAAQETHPQALGALEVYLATPDRERAGQFVLTRELAEQLNGGGTEVSQFFLENVQF